MVNGTNWGAIYRIELASEVDWFDIFPDLMKITRTCYPPIYGTNSKRKQISISGFRYSDSYCDDDDAEVKGLLRKMVIHEQMMWMEPNKEMYREYDPQQILTVPEIAATKTAFEAAINSREVRPFILTTAEKRAVEFVCEYARAHDIEVVSKGWKYTTESY